jgi:hypothetical protein
MRLRKNLQRPQKLLDEIQYGKKQNDPTRPANPELLRSQVVPFNPNLPPAAFPSLPFSTESSGKGDGEANTRTAADPQASSDGQLKMISCLRSKMRGADQFLDDFEMSDAESLLTGFHPRTRNVPTFTSPVDASLEDDMASSEDEDDDCNVLRTEDHRQPSDTQDLDNGQTNPQVSTRVRRVRPDRFRAKAVY